MIPKVIHYCWFGGKPLPKLAIKCIESWKKYLPDYEIKEWNETNFDINLIPYTKEAYQAKRYAFVSDYARFWILYHYGGLYFDTDVEIINPMDNIIAKGPFMGRENDSELSVAPGLGLSICPKHPLYKEILDTYSKLHCIYEDGTFNEKTVVTYVSEILYERGLRFKKGIQECEGIYIYPKDYFCPKDFLSGKLRITPNTVTIHHYDGSWLQEDALYMRKLAEKLGNKKISYFIAEFVMRLKFHGIGSAFSYLTEMVTKRF